MIQSNKRKYYYIVSGLPDVHLGQTKGAIKTRELIQSLMEDLHHEDKRKLSYIFLPFDNLNLLNLCFGNKKSWHDLSNFSYEILKDGIEGGVSGIPSYLYDFYDQFLKGNLFQEEYVWEHHLNEMFFEYVIRNTNGFLKHWYIFVRDLRNILAGLSARYHEYSLDHQLVGNNEVTDKIKNSHMYDFNLSLDFPFIEFLIRLHQQDDIMELEKQIDLIRWNKIEELTEYSYFSFDTIAGHVLKLAITDRWSKYNAETGSSLFSKKIQSLSHQVNFSKEFAI